MKPSSSGTHQSAFAAQLHRRHARLTRIAKPINLVMWALALAGIAFDAPHPVAACMCIVTLGTAAAGMVVGILRIRTTFQLNDELIRLSSISERRDVHGANVAAPRGHFFM